MNHKEIINQVFEILEEHLGIGADIITMDSTLEELGADDLDIVDLIMALEEEFDIVIPSEDEYMLTSVRSIIDYILNY